MRFDGDCLDVVVLALTLVILTTEMLPDLSLRLVFLGVTDLCTLVDALRPPFLECVDIGEGFLMALGAHSLLTVCVLRRRRTRIPCECILISSLSNRSLGFLAYAFFM